MGMADQNTESKNTAQKAFDDAQTASDEADAAEEIAKGEEWQAVGHWNVTKVDVAKQEEIVDNKNTAQINLQEAKEQADDNKEAAQMDFNFGSVIIEKEKAKLAEIKAILQQMAQADIQTSRRLLALVKIDPDKLDSVDALIDELVEKADRELEEFTNALKTANEALADKEAKNADLEVKRTAKDVEVNRVDGENTTLNEVIGLLKQLLN